LRTLAQSLWGEEISFEVGRRIVDTLVQGSNGSLSAVAAEGLTLAEAASRLTPAHDGDELPATKETAVPPTKKAKRSMGNLKNIIKDTGLICFASEPITDFPHPWGLRLDGMSVWSIRSFGWLELGFDTAYFRNTLDHFTKPLFAFRCW
jgi:hypothetical protein